MTTTKHGLRDSSRRFVVQRWEVPHPAAPDGIAIIGFDADSDAYWQHYSDSRGVARVYSMILRDSIWQLVRDTPDFSPLEFAQRLTARFIDDNNTIHGSSGDQRRPELEARLVKAVAALPFGLSARFQAVHETTVHAVDPTGLLLEASDSESGVAGGQIQMRPASGGPGRHCPPTR